MLSIDPAGKSAKTSRAPTERRGLAGISPVRLSAWFFAVTLILDLIAIFIPMLLFPAGILQLIAVLALVVVVARFRDDDLLEAGVLVAVITGVRALVVELLAQAHEYGTVWAAVIGIPTAFLGLTLRAAIVGSIAAGFVWLIRAVLTRPQTQGNS